MAVIAQFFYVAAQTGNNSFFINYVTELDTAINDRQAALILSFGGMGIFFAGWLSIFALFLSYFFMSIMFPTIFSLGIKGLGNLTRQASSFIVMAIVGGALCPVLMGHIADRSTMQNSFVIPLVCFIVVIFYGIRGYRIKTN